MTVLTRWEPFRELNTLQARLNRLFEEQVQVRLPGTPLKVSDSRPVIGYATFPCSTTVFLETALASAANSAGISR